MESKQTRQFNTAALGLKRKSPLNLSIGFTIVELLVVIVVIAILAAITVIAYNGITIRAVESSMSSDLRNAATVIHNENTTHGSYPLNAASANGGQGLKSSTGNILAYEQKSYGFCVSVTNPKSTKTFRLKSNTGQIDEGVCNVVVSTLAGSGVQGSLDGTGTAAQFSVPSDVAVDANGNVYVAHASHNIRKITPAGVVTTLAGSGAPGFADGTGSSAQFNSPYGITIDDGGTVYVSDTNNSRIRKISPSGTVSTIPTFGSPGYGRGLAIDSAGNIYIALNGSSQSMIKRLSSTGTVTTFAGSGVAGFADGTGSAAQFSGSIDVAIDRDDNLYVADADNHRIRKITPAGVVTTFAGSGVAGFADGTGSSAQFNTPRGVAVDANGTVYVGDSNNHRIRQISSSGEVTTLAGSGSNGSTNGTGTTASFSYPRGVAVDTNGGVYVADFSNHRIRKIQQ